MSMIGLSSDEYAREMVRRWCKGKIRSYVARQEEPATKVVKSLNTMLKTQRISKPQLQAIILEVELKSVRPFVNSSDYTVRQARLEEIKSTLTFKS